ncbi:IS3 family transposase [Paenibacillus radicis (ex Gao et al. 2016)]
MLASAWRLSSYPSSEGWLVNHKKVLRLMQEMNLKSIIRRKI